MTGALIDGDPSDPDSPAAAQTSGPAKAPTASTVRFALLVAAVLAAGTAMFISVHGYLPDRADALRERTDRCAASLNRDPAFARPTAGQRDQVIAAFARYRACLRPALLESTGAVAVGFGLLFGLAGVSYAVYPWWIVRRRRLRRLSAGNSPSLVTYLDQLSRELGLARAPDWRVAPYHRAAGGQAFGAAWHRYVQLDAGLLVRFATDRPAFRAVVLHELAHLKNRDVDKTYLTIGIWRAFLLVAVLPYAALIVHPALFVTPLDWQPNASRLVYDPGRGSYQVVVLLALAGLVYLTRNAVLRVRETHADAVAAAHDGPASALPAVLERLPLPQRRWWTRWGTHPHPAQRLAAVRDPRLLLSAGLWELAGAGIAAGIFAANLVLMLGVVAGFDPTLGVGLVGLAAGTALAVTLAVSVWRATAAAPGRVPATRTWLLCPLVLTGGFLVGQFLRLDEVPLRLSAPTAAKWGSWAVSSLLLSVGAVLLAVWLASSARGILAAQRPRRWAMPALVGAAIVAGATTLAVWLPVGYGTDGFGIRGSDPLAAGAGIDWYAWLATLTGWQLKAAAHLVYNPLTLLALALLWLVPVLAGLRRSSHRVPLRRAVIPALIGAGCAMVVAAALPFLAKTVLPASVRQVPAPDAVRDSFPVVIANVYIFTGIVAVVVVMAVVVLRGGPYRPALAVFAAMLTSLLYAASVNHVAIPMQCYANVFGREPAPRQCLEPLDLGYLAELVDAILVQGLVVAIPAVVVAAAAGAQLRRGWPSSAAPATPPTTLGFIVTVVGIVLLAIAIGALTWGILPESYAFWLKSTFG